MEKFRKFLDEDRWVSLRTVAAQPGVGEVTVHRTVHENLSMRKMCAKFVPRLLSDEQERRVGDSKEMVQLIASNPSVIDSLVPCDESWIYCYEPETPCDFWMFPRLKEKLRGRCFEDVEEMEEAVTETLDTFTFEDYQLAFKKWLEHYNKCIELGGFYFEGDRSFMLL